MMAKVLFPIVLLGSLLFVGCTVEETAVTPIATAVLIVESVDTPTPQPTATSQPTAVATEAVVEEIVPTAVPSTEIAVPLTTDEEQLQQELEALAFPAGMYAGVYALPLGQDNVWLAHSVGLGPEADNPAVALYQYDGTGQWLELARTEVLTPDILFEGMITPVNLGDGRYWFEEQSFIGVHGSCYELWRYAAGVFTVEISSCNSSRVSEGMGDLNHNGRPDIVLSQSIDYVFCYACGVRYPAFMVYEFAEDNSWQTVTVQRLDEDVFPDLRDTNNEAVRLFEMGLYKQAAETINPIVGDVPTVLWNQAIINIYAEATRFQAQGGPYPLLGQMFYGNYDAVLEMMRPYAPAELFAIQGNPLMAGTMAEGWEDTLADWVVQVTAPVVAGQPDMDSAHFLYAWGLYLTDVTDARVIGELETAVSINPNEPLYQDALAFVRGEVR